MYERSWDTNLVWLQDPHQSCRRKTKMEKRAFLSREMIDQQEVTSALLVLWRSPCDSTTVKVIPLAFRFTSTKNNVFKPEQHTLNSHRNSFESLFFGQATKGFLMLRSATDLRWPFICSNLGEGEKGAMCFQMEKHKCDCVAERKFKSSPSRSNTGEKYSSFRI